jgi:carbonic anhydrase
VSDHGFMFPLLPDPTAPSVSVLRSGGPPMAATAAQAATAAMTADAAAARWPGPERALSELMAGNQRFVAGIPRYGYHVGAATAADQRPYAAVVTCMDARLGVEAIFDQDFGRVCSIRTAGHVVDDVAFASLDLAVTALGVGFVLVLGHRRCAAVGNALDLRRTGREAPASLEVVFDDIDRSIRAEDLDRPDVVDVVIRRHVGQTVRDVRDSLADGPASGAPVRVAGAVYDMGTGRVELLH